LDQSHTQTGILPDASLGLGVLRNPCMYVFAQLYIIRGRTDRPSSNI
jgi:hypothetical protein